jgi:FMN hydrolase / 5-amino-6-(5-phospho-D-ribitylamino)uracil phosphatase
VTAIFFDGDQTLWDFESIMRRAMAATMIELARLVPGLDPAALAVDDVIADRDQVAHDLAGRVIDLRVIRERGFARTLQRLGFEREGLAAELTAYYMRLRHAATDPFPDAATTLPSLAWRHRLGLLTNGNSDPARFGLADVLHWSFTAVELGVAKPDPEIYRRVNRMTGVPPGQSIMVGDSLINDVISARRAGWRGIWLDRASAAGPEQTAHADAVITSLTELEAVVRRWSAPLG